MQYKTKKDKYFFTKQCKAQRCKSRLKREKNQININLKTNKYWNKVSIFFALLKKLSSWLDKNPRNMTLSYLRKTLSTVFCAFYVDIIEYFEKTTWEK